MNIKKTGIDIKSLRAAGGLDNSETIEKYQRITGGCFYVGYGQTETSSMVTFGPYNEKPGSAGRMVPLSLVKIVDDHDREVSLGQLGEIIMKGPMVFKGYWNLQEENKFVFRDAWHHTGDLGRFDDDGFLWYAGRKAEKELIKTGGENVYPAEVEKVILMHSGIKETVVIGVPDTEWGEAIKAVCVPKKETNLQSRSWSNLSVSELPDSRNQNMSFLCPNYPKLLMDF